MDTMTLDTMTCRETLIGKIHEGGIIKSLEQKGHDDISCLDELLSNCYDANAKNVNITRQHLYGEKIAISDDGDGLNETDADNMYNAYYVKSRNKTIGMSGIGAKAALYLLSKKTETINISLKDGAFITIIAPWNKIIEEQKYTDNIVLRSSTQDEIDLFCSIINGTSGTILFIPFCKIIWEKIKTQFVLDEPVEILKSLSVRYGFTPDDFNIKFDSEHVLKKYNPSHKVTIRKIYILKNKFGEIKYISDKDEEFPRVGKGTSTERRNTPEDQRRGYKLVNTLEIHICLPYDKDYKVSAATWYPRELDIFKGSHDRDVAEKIKASDYPLIIRNDYVLGQCLIDILKISNRRSSATAREYFDHFTAIIWNQSDNTSIDDIIGTQENKGQLHDKIEVSLKRLIHSIKVDEIEEFKRISEKERISKIKKCLPVKPYNRVCSGDSVSIKDANPILSDSDDDSDDSDSADSDSDDSKSDDSNSDDSDSDSDSDSDDSHDNSDTNTRVESFTEPSMTEPLMIETSTIVPSTRESSIDLQEFIDNLDKLKSKIDFTNPTILQIHKLIKSILK